MSDESAEASKAKKATPPATRPSRPKGWKRDLAHHVAAAVSAAALFGAPVNLPPECLDLKDYVLSVYDQGQTSSCVGNAIAKAIHVRLRRIQPTGAPEPTEPSRLAIYDTARRRGMKDPKAPLDDGGCIPSEAMAGVREVGVASEEAWPFDPAKINWDEPWHAFQDAAKFLLFQWYRVTATGASISDAIANALVHGYPVVFGMDLWQAFEDYSGGTVDSLGMDDVGGHMMCILGYRTRADKRREFLVINSWGASWGEQGYAWIHEDVLAYTSETGRSSDYYAIQVG